jgi:hypothetical protein
VEAVVQSSALEFGFQAAAARQESQWPAKQLRAFEFASKKLQRNRVHRGGRQAARHA